MQLLATDLQSNKGKQTQTAKENTTAGVPILHQSNKEQVVLGGIMVSVISIGPNVRGFKPGGFSKPKHSAARLPSEEK
jgi:hypothetical protein